MRTPSKEYLKLLEKNELYQLFVRHQKPDFSELDKICQEFERDILEAQKNDQKRL